MRPLITDQELFAVHRGWPGQLTEEHAGLFVTPLALVRAQARNLRLPERFGDLFDPNAYPFLEGRPHGDRRGKVCTRR